MGYSCRARIWHRRSLTVVAWTTMGESRGRAAVLAPSGNYRTDAPLLTFGLLVVEERGASLHQASWGPSHDDLYARVEATVAAALDELGPEIEPIITGKPLERSPPRWRRTARRLPYGSHRC
jgi:hypothetical protein